MSAKLEYLAKRGHLGLEALDIAHAEPQRLLEMYPHAATQVAGNMLEMQPDEKKEQMAQSMRGEPEEKPAGRNIRSRAQAELNERLMKQGYSYEEIMAREKADPK